MAFNRKNLLTDIMWVQEVYKKQNQKGFSNRHILREFINTPGRRPISERTLYYYLEISPKVELRKIEAEEKKQLSLF